MKIRDIGEIGLVERLAGKIRTGPSVLRGIGDDAAVIRLGGGDLLLYACDMLIEDVHFTLKEATPFQIGWKALGVNISDIAAMGGIPRYAVVSVGINPEASTRLIDGLYDGIRSLAKKFGVEIVGGDTNSSEKLVIDVSLLGLVKRKKLVTRDGARRGDLILVTGEIGGSAKGRHLKFMPRMRESTMLVSRYKVHAMIDVSDGLALDLWRVLKASGVGAVIYENAIPISKDARSFKEAIREGEDFELVFTMGAEEARRFYKKGFFGFGTPVSIIGKVVDKKEGFRLVEGRGGSIDLKPSGFTHF
jgi:thiamine-monophosphate kinase